MEKKKTESKVKTKVKKEDKKFTDLEGNVIKKEKVEKKKKQDVFKEHIKKYRKLYSLIVIAIVLVAILTSIIIGIKNFVINKKYKIYEEDMEAYGFAMLYNNQSPKSSEKVTRLEMVKIILSSIYNSNEVRSIGFGPQGTFDGDEWATTAEAFGLVEKGYITNETYDKEATLKEAVMTYLNARSNLLEMPISSTVESKFRNLQSYTELERRYINDAAENGLIDNTRKKINLNSKMFKGEFNKLVVRFVQKYNTLAPEGDEIVTKKESKPSNYDIYPYILYSVSKEAYEYKGINEGGVDYKSPKETYKYDKDYYSQMEYRAEYYYNTILNIDYRNVNRNEFLEKTDRYLRFDYKEKINKYLDYVKEHKVIIEGKAKVQLPVFYLDGIRFRARLKLDFEIKNADTNINLLLGDQSRQNEVTYEKKVYTIYIDAPMGTTMASKALMLDMEPIIDMMVSNIEAKTLNKF